MGDMVKSNQQNQGNKETEIFYRAPSFLAHDFFSDINITSLSLSHHEQTVMIETERRCV